MEGKRDITGHGQHVRQGEPHEDAVDGRVHVLAGQHGDVDEVHGDAEEADELAQVPVHPGVPFVELVQVLDGEGRRQLLQTVVRHRSLSTPTVTRRGLPGCYNVRDNGNRNAFTLSADDSSSKTDYVKM